MIYENYSCKNYYEAITFAILYAIDFDININNLDINVVLKSNDCILLLISFLYFKKNNLKSEVKLLKNFAKELQNSGEMDRYWLFIYECLNKQKGEWNTFKKNKISFLKNEYRF